MTNPMIEKKVEEFRKLGGTFVPDWEIENEKKEQATNWLRQALTGMYEMGQGKGNENGYELGVDVGKKTGAADMKKRIFEALPKAQAGIKR